MGSASQNEVVAVLLDAVHTSPAVENAVAATALGRGRAADQAVYRLLVPDDHDRFRAASTLFPFLCNVIYILSYIYIKIVKYIKYVLPEGRGKRTDIAEEFAAIIIRRFPVNFIPNMKPQAPVLRYDR